MSEQLLIPIIEALGMVLAALITSFAVIVGANKISHTKKLRSDLVVAYRDIHTLYTIERFHTEINIAVNDKNNKVHVRKLVDEQTGLYLSGKNTPSQVKRRINALEAVVD